ncbi:NAD-dependent epimerase/dehydratase family protein [Candidatus Roizmanbacteria bacterium]|nr:NAD-dependent epimerase/dehydratase family protein [Candidatus Roizmanbacteria bacterium]
MKKTILITGGRGFIGINIIRRLLATSNYSITVLERSKNTDLYSLVIEKKYLSRINIVNGDILRPKTIEKAMRNADIVIHAAANIGTSNPLASINSMVKTNVIGTSIMLESVRKYPVEKFILLSSAGVYADNKLAVTTDEHHELNPISPYTASKLAGDYIARSLYYSSNVPVIILRPFNVYGPFQRTNQMIPLFITKLIRRQKITLNHSGSQTRDWVYVDDVANAISLIIKASSKNVVGKIFNISTGIETSVSDVARMILKELLLDDSYLAFSKYSQTEVLRSVGNSTYIQNTVGWKPAYSLKNGIKQTVSWYKNHSPEKNYGKTLAQ